MEVTAASEGEARAAGGPGAGREALFVLLLVALCLAPFLGRALDFDDPLFVWVARRIAEAPLDPYGLEVNWYGRLESLAEITKNPPLHSYLLALPGALGGWSEHALHLVPFAAASCAALGTLVLARRLCRAPLVATLATVATPAFLVSSTTLMADATLLALWMWSLCLWERGLRESRTRWFLLAGFLAGLAALTKYFGLALVPLLALWAVARHARLARWAPALLVPVALVGLWELASARLYGRGLVLDAILYARSTREAAGAPTLGTLAASLSFLGGSAASLLVLAPWLAARRALLVLLALGLGIALAVLLAPERAQLLLASPARPDAGQAAQLGLWAAVGAGGLLLVGADLARRRDGEALVLGAWVLGTLLFAVAGNWTVNVRSLLPAVPALGILAARRMESRAAGLAGRPRGAQLVALAAALLLALGVARAGLQRAEASRRAAELLGERYGQEAPVPCFQGHWGFQYYAEAAGLRALDLQRASVEVGQIVVLPLDNTNVVGVPAATAVLVETLEFPASRWLALQRGARNAGFHSSGWGFLPFAVGPVEPLRFRVWQASERFDYR